VNLIYDFPAHVARRISVNTGLESVKIMWRGVSCTAECIVLRMRGRD
jgi:hypothetical protein